MEHTISVLVENRFGVLARIAGLFAGRGFNIKSLAVGETEDRTTSRMTIVAEGDDKIIEQIKKQLNKLIDVIKISDLSEKTSVFRELALIKVNVAGTKKIEIMQIVEVFRAKIVDISHETMMIEVTGTGDKINALIDLLRPYGIVELARTGRIALQRG
jgi:acetolactate synthase-1/3 small subunit